MPLRSATAHIVHWCVISTLGSVCVFAAAATPPAIIAPTQGRPVFVTPGGRLEVTVTAGDVGDATPSFKLVSRHPFVHEVPLVPDSADAPGPAPAVCALPIPADIPQQTYDLVVTWGDASTTAPHAVAVQQVGRRVRLVHLSNFNVGSVAAPDFDQRLVAEVNLLAPTLLIVTGDVLDATHPDPDAGWRDFAAYLAAFDAPAVVACGDHDDLSRYSKYMAPSPVGAVTVGGYEIVVLYDLPARPISDDVDQIQWVESHFGQRGPDVRIMVSHDDRPNLLAYWQAANTLEREISAGRVGLWFVGGHRDWDGEQYAALLGAAPRLLYLRTHQASTATAGGAEGISHYRIVDLAGLDVSLPGLDPAARVAPSLTVGKLQLDTTGNATPTTPTARVTAANLHAFTLDDLETTVAVAKQGTTQPSVRGATLVGLVDVGTEWFCRVRFDLPDKASRRIVVGYDATGTPDDVQVRFEGPSVLTIAEGGDAADTVYVRAADWPGTIELENRGAETRVVSPLIRLDGETLAYRVVAQPGPFAVQYRLRLAPGATLALQPDLSAVRVETGRRTLQVYVQDGAAQYPRVWPLLVRTLGASASR